MSNIENNTNDLNINTTIDGNAATGTAELSVELVNLTKQLQQLSQAAVKQANVTQSWNQAMGMSKAGVSQYSQQLNSSINVITKLSNATRIYKDVLNEAKKSTEGFAQAQSLINSNKGGLDASFVQRYNAGLVQGQSHLSSMTSGSKDLEKAMKRVALIDISKNISRGAQAESNAAYAFTRNFSTPIIGALRESFFSYSKLASESVRTTKLILDNFSNLTEGSEDTSKQMAAAAEFTARLGKELDKVTKSWGTSRVLVQALAGDFAELGISSEYLLADMTRLTVEAEKLGNLDIAQSSSFLTSMYQTILRIRRETGKSVNINEPTGAVSKDIMEQLTGQLAMFNLIENKTVMSLRNISDAFPEVTAAATSFGLSMSEATALIIPMIGAGFQVGASANSLKVSLQRMVAMTKQNTTILNQLNQSLGNGFELSAGVGMDQIQKLSDAYGFLVRDVAKGGKGKQGALELFSRLFGVRQGPRMEAAFAQLNAFQTQLETTGSAEQTVAKQLQNSVNIELKAIGQKEINIKKFKDLSTLHRQAIATDEKGNLTAQAAAIQKGQKEAQRILEKAGGENADFISNMSTEVGKALMAQAFDTKALAGRQYDLELEISQNTPEVRYRRAKESMLALGRAIVPVVDSILKVLLPAFQKLSSFLQNNPAIAKLTGAFLLLAASIGPIRLAFATMKTVFGGAISFFVVMAEKVTGVSYAFASLQDLMSNPDLLRGQNKVVQYLDNFLIKTKRNGKSLRKEMDLTGLSQPVQEMFKGNKAAAIYGTDKAVNMRRITPVLPETSRFLDDMKTLNIENSTQMAAKVASGSEKGIAKGTEGFSEKFQEAAAKAMHRFQGPNLFAGPNYFEGNIPGDGDGVGSTGRKGRGGGGGSGAAAVAAAAGLTKADADLAIAEQMTLNKRAKKEINNFFKNPLGIGNIAEGGPTPKNTDGLVSSIEKLRNAMKGQSSSSPPRQLAELTTGRPGGALELFRQVVKSPYYHTPGMTDIGRSGTSGVLLSTLQKIEAALPKSMSGRIVRDVSQSYGFPLTGQGRIPYSSPSIQQILPRSAVTVADKIKSQMSFAPRALMPGKPENSTLLTFAQILKWHKEAGVQLSQTLESALTTASTRGWSVSPKTLAKIKKSIFAQLTTKTGKPKNFLKLAGGESGMDKRLKNFVTIPRDILPANTADEMAPFLQELNDRIETFTKSGVDQTVATMNDLQVMAEDSTRLGVSGRPLRDFSRGLLVPVKDMQTGVEDNFIAIERTARRLKLSQADYLSGLEDVVPQIITESSIVPNLHGPLTVAGDEYLQALRKAAVGTHRIEETLNEKGEKIQRLVRVEGAKSKDAVNNEILRAADIAAMKADEAAEDFRANVVEPKGKRWDESLVASLEKEDPELQSILGGLKKNIDNATSPKEKLAAFQELDQFLFQQERYAIASRIKLTEEARRSAQSGDIRQIKRTISDLKKQKAAALRKITEDSKSAIANGTQFIQPPVNLSDLDARYAAVSEVEQELNQEMLAKRQALQIAHQAELDSANKILTEEMEAASTPSAKQKLEKRGLEKVAEIRKMHAEELKYIEREIEDNRRIISDARSRLDASPASFDSQIHDAETKLNEILPSTDLSDAEKTLIKERKELNRKIKKAGYIPPNRPTADILTLQDRIAAMNAPVDTSGVIFEEELSRAERVAKRNAAAMASERARGPAVAIGETPGRIDMMGKSVVPQYSPYTPVYPKPIVKPVVPPSAYPQTTSRFLGPKFDQARIPSVTDFYGKPFRLKDYPIRTSFATPTAPAIPDAKQSILGRIKGLFGRNKSAGISDAGHLDLGGLFRTPKSVGAAAVPMRGVNIVEKFAEGLRKELGEVLTGAGHDIDKLMTAMNTIARHPKTGHKAAADATRAFFDHLVELPDDAVNKVMQATIKDITATFRSQTAAGMAGPNSKAHTKRSLRSFVERLRKNLGGVPGEDGKTVVEGVYQKFFGARPKGPKLELDPRTEAGLAQNLKDVFVDGMKSNYVGLASGEEARSSVPTGLRLQEDILQPGQGRQRDTRDGARASRRRFSERTGRAKKAITQAVGDVNQELTDLRTQLANKVQGLIDQKNIVVPDVAAQMVASIVDPIDQFQQDVASSLDEGVKVITGDVKDIDVPNMDDLKGELVRPLVQAQEQMQDVANSALDAFDPSVLDPADIVETVTVKPVGKKAGKPITKKAQKALDRAAKELATAFKEIDSSTIRAGEILKTTDLKKIKLNAPLKIKQISESVVMAEKEYAEAFAAAQIAHPSKGSTGINNLSGVAAKKNRLELFKKELADLEKYINQSLLIEQETARLLSEAAKAPKVIPANKTTGAGKPTLPPPENEEEKTPRIVRKRRSRGIPIGDDGGDGKAFNIDKIGHRFQGPNIFSKNIFDANLKDIIPNFDDLMAGHVAGATAVATGGQTAGAALTEGAAAVTAASVALKQSAISKALFGNKALKGQFAAGAEKSVIESLFGKQMKKRNIIPEYVTEKLEDGTEKTLLSSATRKRSLLPFGRIPIGLPIKQDLADIDRLLTKGVLPNFTRLKKLLTGALGKTWLFALSGGLSVLIGPLTKVLKNFGGLKQVFAGTATIFAQSGSMLKGVAAGAGQITSNVFGGIQKAATVGLNIFSKLAGAILLVGTGLLIIVPIIGILIALYGMFKSANGRLAGAATALKEAFKALVDGAKALFAPVRDLIFVFIGADKQMGGLTSEGQKNAAFFTIIANAIKKATTAFKEWAETIGAAFVKNTVVPQITRIINKFILLGSAIKDFSNGDKTAGMAKLKAVMVSFAYDIVGILKIITVGLINAFAYAAPVIIQVMQGLLQLLGEMIWAAMKEIGENIAEGTTNGILKGVINTSPLLRGVLKLDDLFGVSDAGVTFAQSYEKKSQKEKALEGVDPGLRKYVSETPIKPPTEAEKNIKKWDAKLRDLIKSAGVGVGGAYDKILAELDRRYVEVLGATNIKVNGINVPIVIDKGSPKGVIDQIAYIVKESADAATAGGESLMDQINNGMKSKVAEIKDTLKGAFYSNVDEKFDDIVTQYTDALEKQKDQQLKAYDDQITAIDELAAAEERLTDTKDYESKKREIIDKRQYDHENYSVERKLAVYEGRTFDVRRLDREEVASKTESDKSLTDLDSDRLKTLQSAQRDLAKQAIANQKDLAEEEFDVILKSFDEFMKGVKNKSFATQEEFAAALKGVADKALSSSLELGTAFETGLAKLPAAIAAVRDPALAMFSASMGDLINEAAISFGVNTKSKDPKSLLGAVGLMVSGVEQGFKDAFSTTFAPLYVKPAVDAITLITSSLSKPGDPNNIKDIWTKAGKDAFEALESELNRTIAWEKIFKSFDDLFDGLKPKIKKVVDLAVAAQNALANVGGQTAAPTTILDEATMKDFQATTLTAAKKYGAGKAYIPPAQLGIMATRVTEFIGAHISEGSVGILSSAARADSGLSATEIAILKLALPALNIASGALALTANPNAYAYRTDSEGRTGFMYGGQVGRYGIGGYLKAPASQGIPALLHGGEYIINHKAVEKFGKGNLERINNLKNGGDFRGFASGGYMTVPGFANGGYMTIPGFAKGGAVRRNVGNKPKQSDSNQTNNGMKLFTNKNGQSYYVPDTNVRSGANSGMILHPLDWQAIAVSENGQDWEKDLGKVSKTDKGVFVGALNIARANWMRFGQGKFGNFNDPLNPPSFENQIKVAEIMYKGLASDPSAWGRAPKYLDGFEGVRLGRVDFPKLSDLSTYNRLKAQGLALGGSVRKYGSADAMERASASPKFIGPMPPVVKPTKQGVFGKVGGFLSKAITDTTQSFAKIGSGGLNIASALVESPLALVDKRLSFNPITNLQKRNQDQIDNGINYIRGINRITGLNLPGGETGGLGQIAGGKLTNFGDAFNVITSIPGLGQGFKLTPTIGKLVVGRMGLSATEMTLGQIMKPGVMAVVNNALTREAAALAGRGALQGFDSTILNPANIIDTQIVRPRLALPPAPSQIPKVAVEDFFGDGFAPRLIGRNSAFTHGEGGAFDKTILELFDELDGLASGATQNLPTITRREMLRAQLQVSGAIPKAMQSPEDLAFYNMMLDNLLGLGDNARGVSGVDPEAFGELTGIFDALNRAASAAFTPKNIDPRIIPASGEVFDYQFLQQDIGKQIQDLLRDSEGVIPPDIRSKVTEALGYRPKTGNMMEEFPFMHLPIGNQPLISGELLRSRFNEALATANALRDQMALAPKALGMGTKGGSLAIPSIMEGSRIPREILSRTMQIGDDALTQSFDAWKIGLEEVSFGVNRSRNPFTNLYETANQYGSTMPSNEYPGLDWLNDKLVKNIPLNPYDISGESEFTEVGRGVASLWANAHVGYKFENPAIDNKDTFVSALLYARSKGDLKARMEMQRLADIGKEQVDKFRLSYNPAPTGNDLLMYQKSIKDVGLSDFTPEDLFLVHETPYKPFIDQFGNAVIRPTSDYQTLFPNDGYPMEYVRDTVHFALNHPVMGHQQRESVKEPFLLVANFMDAMKANPGSLSSLYPVDTVLTPAPGRGLVFPKGTYQLHEKPVSTYGAVKESLAQMMNPSKIDSSYFKHIFKGGDHGSDMGTNQFTYQMARNMNVGSGPHFGSPTQIISGLKRGDDIGIGQYLSKYMMQGLSDNDITRLLARTDLFNSIRTNIEYTGPDRFSNGGYMPKFKKGGYLKFKEGGEVPSILHGGEYVLNAGAVKKYGLAHIEAMNQMRFNVPQPGFSVPQSSFSGSLAGGMSTSTQNVNIYVDNFIGEPEWFNSMMKDYNTTVLPRNQKAAGLESRVISTYSGLNRGN